MPKQKCVKAEVEAEQTTPGKSRVVKQRPVRKFIKGSWLTYDEWLRADGLGSLLAVRYSYMDFGA